MSYTAQLPLNVSTRSTYQEIEEFRDFVKQNVKNLLLTNPGERIMLPDFGVGLSRFLFENADAENTQEKIHDAITNQLSRFLPTVEVINIITEVSDKSLVVKIFYNLTNFNLEDFLEIAVIN